MKAFFYPWIWNLIAVLPITPHSKFKSFYTLCSTIKSINSISSRVLFTGASTNIPPPPPSYSKSSPSLLKKESDPAPKYAAAVPSVSRVVYPRECYKPMESSFETDNEDLHITEVEDDTTERSITPPSMASCPEITRATFTIPDG